MENGKISREEFAVVVGLNVEGFLGRVTRDGGLPDKGKPRISD